GGEAVRRAQVAGAGRGDPRSGASAGIPDQRREPRERGSDPSGRLQGGFPVSGAVAGRGGGREGHEYRRLPAEEAFSRGPVWHSDSGAVMSVPSDGGKA